MTNSTLHPHQIPHFTFDRYGRPTFFVDYTGLGSHGVERVSFSNSADNPQREWVLHVETTGYGQRCRTDRTDKLLGETAKPGRTLEQATLERQARDTNLRASAILTAFLMGQAS